MKHLTFRTFCTLLFAVLSISIMAQQRHVITGRVVDRQTQEGMDYATVRLQTMTKDSTMITGTNTDDDGTFTLTTTKSGKFRLRLSYLGYRSIYKEVELVAAGNGEQTTDTLKMGDLIMYSDDYVLRAAIVQATVAKVQQVEDTTMYNADAFRTPEGATLEALVKQLPGAEVGDDGSITINGKKVNEILVNGKDFFKGDSETAMKNLPVNLVKKIKTYDKKSDYSEQTGIDDGEDSFVLDIMTKHELNQSWLANFDIAGGWDYKSRGLYSGKLFASRFTDKSRITVIGSHNNIGDNGFGGPRGMGGGGGGNGLTTSTMGAIDFSWENGKKRFEGGRFEFGGNARYNRRDNGTESTTSSETFLTNNRDRSFSESHSWGKTLSQSVNASLRLQWSPDSLTSISFRPSYSWSQSRSQSNSISATFAEDPYKVFSGVESVDDVLGQYYNIGTNKQKEGVTYQDFLVNLRDNLSRSWSNSHNINASLNATRRLGGKEGRNVSFSANGGYSSSQNTRYSIANVVTRQNTGTKEAPVYTHTRDNSTWQYQTTPSVNWNVRVGASYVEPLWVEKKLYGEFRYNYTHRFNDQKRSLFDLYEFGQQGESLTKIVNKYTGVSTESPVHVGKYSESGAHTGTLSSEDDLTTTDLLNQFLQMNEADVQAAIRDERNSQYATYRYNNHNINLGIRWNVDDIRLNAGVSINPENTLMDYRKGVVDTTVTRTVFNISPQVRFRWNLTRTRRLEFNFNSGSTQPSMTQLLEVIDTSDPLRISTGNAGLKPSWNNNLRASFNDYNAETLQNIMVNYSFSHNQNTIANLQVYDRQTGRTFSAPQNIEGHWNMNGGVNYGIGFGPNRLISFNTHTNVSFNRSTAYVSTDNEVPLPSVFTNESVAQIFSAALENAQVNVNKTLGVNENLSFAFRQPLWDITASGRVRYQHSRSSLQSNGNMDTWGFDYGVSGNVNLDFGLSISTDIRMNSRRGYAVKSMNTNELLWNAQVSQSFLKDRSLTVSLQFYDILGQQSNISRTINATMRSDSWHMALNSYAMLHVIYKLKVFSGEKSDEQTAPRGGDEPRERMQGTMQGNGMGQGQRGGGMPQGGGSMSRGAGAPMRMIF